MSSPQLLTDRVEVSFCPLEVDEEDGVVSAVPPGPRGLSKESVVSEFERLLSKLPTNDHVDSIET